MNLQTPRSLTLRTWAAVLTVVGIGWGIPALGRTAEGMLEVSPVTVELNQVYS
jgi:hypothetical protein